MRVKVQQSITKVKLNVSNQIQKRMCTLHRPQMYFTNKVTPTDSNLSDYYVFAFFHQKFPFSLLDLSYV